MILKVEIKDSLPVFDLHISMMLKEKNYCVLLGESGSGKSTVLKTIAGLRRADYEKIYLHKKDISGLLPERREIAYLPQGYSLFPHMSVYKNIVFPFEAKKLQVDRKFLDQVVTTFQIAPLLDRKPVNLSGGEIQRVALARAICSQPKVLLLDEPLGSVDFHIKLELIDFLKRLPKIYAVTILHVTHDLIEAEMLAEKIYLMVDGKITFYGTWKDFVEKAPGRLGKSLRKFILMQKHT